MADESGLPSRDLIDALFARMAQTYASRWVSQFGMNDIGTKETWRRLLNGLSATDFGRGVERCFSGERQRLVPHARIGWPPSLDEFRYLCTAKEGPRENAAAYRPFPPALPGVRTPERRRAAMVHIRQILGGAGQRRNECGQPDAADDSESTQEGHDERT